MKFTSSRSAAKLELCVLASLYRKYSSRMGLHPIDGHVGARQGNFRAGPEECTSQRISEMVKCIVPTQFVAGATASIFSGVLEVARRVMFV